MKSLPATVRRALPTEATVLTDLIIRSKRSNGYDKAFMAACRDELTVDRSRIGSVDYRCFVVVEDNSILGFYALESIAEDVHELDALFVEPAQIGTGIGRLLIQHALQILANCGAVRLIIQGDPNATEFYKAAGARQIGTRESDSIPGRYLPLFELEIDRV